MFQPQISNAGSIITMMPSEWVPSPDSSYASSPSNSNSGSGSSSPPRCEISLLERLIRTHPLWFIPSLQRSGALHLLQGREVGNFIVRSSREPDTMAVSVKLHGNQVEHYLLLKAAEENRIALQDSEHSFPTVHQLIAHYCEHSDEIPVCLRVPGAIAEATTRQHLRSLALLGQEFWTISSSPPPAHRGNAVPEQGSPPSPSDADSSQSHHLPSKSSGIGSQSSSSQNSLCDSAKKPCRPTTLTLELGRSRTLLSFNGCIGGGGVSGITPLSVPVLPVTNRWLTPTLTPTSMTSNNPHQHHHTLSQPSSVQSTPSEQISSMSDRINFRLNSHAHHNHHNRKSKKNSAAKSIHYKDTEIIDLFKGSKTVLDDKLSDYEDVWSNSNPHTPSTPSASRRLFTFKPDVIPLNTPEFPYPQQNKNQNHRHLNQSKSLSLCVTPTNGNFSSTATTTEDLFRSRGGFPANVNFHNRLSLKNININLLNSSGEEDESEIRSKKSCEYLDKISTSSNKGHYSEPLDSINLNINNNQRQQQQQQHRIIHNRWSQPVPVLSTISSQQSQTQNIKPNNSNLGPKKQKRHIFGSKSSDNLNCLGISFKDSDVSDSNVTLDYQTSRIPTSSSSSWQVDNSWKFCCNQKTDSEERTREMKRSENEKNVNNLRLKLGFDSNFAKQRESTQPPQNAQTPLSPSPENWDNLLRLVTESTRQLESLPLNENESCNNSVESVIDNGSGGNENDSIRKIVEGLAKKQNGVFGPMLKSFVCCTLSGKLHDPFKVLRNIRQFISGMKNYLVGVSPESDLIHKEIKKRSGKLGPSEFLNVDLILEQILVDLVIQPLYSHLMTLLRNENRKSALNIHCNNYTEQNNLRNQKFLRIYESFENSISPITKLDKWNEFVCEVKGLNDESHSLEFFAVLTSSLRQVCSVDVESHADFVVGLLPPCISERNVYSLSLLQSVVSSLKISCSNGSDEEGNTKISGYGESVNATTPGSEVMRCVKVIVPDERSGTLIRKVVPIRESMTSKEVAKLISSKLGISNTSDYVLVTVRHGEERICQENDLIQKVLDNESAAFAYRRVDAKIGWPIRIT